MHTTARAINVKIILDPARRSRPAFRSPERPDPRSYHRRRDRPDLPCRLEREIGQACGQVHRRTGARSSHLHPPGSTECG